MSLRSVPSCEGWISTDPVTAWILDRGGAIPPTAVGRVATVALPNPNRTVTGFLPPIGIRPNMNTATPTAVIAIPQFHIAEEPPQRPIVM